MNSPIKPICLLIDAPCKALACSDQRCKPWEATSDHMIPGNDALANADLVSKNGVQGWDIAVDIHHKQPVMVVELPMKELNRVVIVTDVNVVKIVSATGCTCFYSVGWSLFHVDFQIFVFSFWILLKSTYSVNIQQIQIQRWSSGQQHSRPFRRDIITLPVKTIKSGQKSLQRGCDLQALHMKPHLGPFFHTFAPTLCTSDFTRMVKNCTSRDPRYCSISKRNEIRDKEVNIYIIYIYTVKWINTNDVPCMHRRCTFPTAPSVSFPHPLGWSQRVLGDFDITLLAGKRWFAVVFRASPLCRFCTPPSEAYWLLRISTWSKNSHS